jgi:predicted transcriptional regulator
MMAQRRREEIISLLLQSAENGATQTTLMYESYLSHDALKGYLALLLEKGLLEYLAGEMKFKTTASGLVLLTSKIGSGDKACNHQCKKCGGLYYCKEAACANPFHYAACQNCMEFFGPLQHLGTLQ